MTKSKSKNLFFALITAALVIVLIELSLNLLASASTTVDWLISSPGNDFVPDKRLGHRPNPEYPGHDHNGFRNKRVPVEVDIVALGDSQTYGFGVESKYAWPKQLESLAGTSVYSMAYGGYGPVHSLILLDEAIKLRPKIIIEGFYSGNDLYDSFNLVYNKGQLPELQSLDPQVQASVKEREEAERIADHAGRKIAKSSTLQKYLARYSKIYGLLHRLWTESKPRWSNTNAGWAYMKAFANRQSAYTQVFDDGEFRTLFTPQYRLSALNLADPRIREGQRLALESIKLMSKRAHASRIRFLVLLIPTKEFVFYEVATDSNASYRALIENERQFWLTTKEFLEHHEIEYRDALSDLRKRFSTGVQPYPISTDGHPNEAGHLAIAESAQSYIRSGIPGKKSRLKPHNCGFPCAPHGYRTSLSQSN